MSNGNRSKTGASLEEVAAAAGVSKMTVSRVLRDKSGFSQDTRDKVMREVARLGYLPNRLAIAFAATGSSTLIGVCIPRITSAISAEILENIDRTLSRLGYQTMIGNHMQIPEEEEKWLRVILSWRPAGIMLSGREHTAGTINLLKSAALPVVELLDLNTSPIDMSVGFDHFDCGYEMARFIVSRGRRRIGFVGAMNGTATFGLKRFNGFSQGVSNAGFPVIGYEILDDKPGFYAGYYGTENLLARCPDLDAIYFHDDAMAIGGMAYCQSKGYDIPGDIGIAGFGGMEAASVLPQRLTTTIVPTESLGNKAAEALALRLRGEPVNDVIVVPARLAPGATM
jgi:LacI family gluconate utilization system Gnt-I transcriptional repressor